MKAEEAIAVNSDLRSLGREIESLQRELDELKAMRDKPDNYSRIEVGHDFGYGDRKKPSHKLRVDAVLDEMRHDIIRAAELAVERDLRLLKNRRRVVKHAFDEYFDDGGR